MFCVGIKQISRCNSVNNNFGDRKLILNNRRIRKKEMFSCDFFYGFYYLKKNFYYIKFTYIYTFFQSYYLPKRINVS